MTVKRRVIWLDDESWESLKQAAIRAGMNPSQFIAGLARPVIVAREELERASFGTSRPAPTPKR